MGINECLNYGLSIVDKIEFNTTRKRIYFKESNMNFQEAVTGLQAGLYLTRNAWDATGEYVILLPGMQYIWKIIFQPNPSCGNWLPTISDIMADDWKQVEVMKINLPT
jgi:hypothetical protein